MPSPLPEEAAKYLAVTAESLMQAPIGEFFRVKCRRLGAVADATTLRNRGWTMVRQDATTHPRLSCGCLWWSKVFRRPGDDTPWEAYLATSAFVEPREDDPRFFRDVDASTARRLARGRGTARVFLRKFFFYGYADDGLTFTVISDTDVPEEVVAALDDDFSESELFAPGSFVEDLDYQLAALDDADPSDDFAEKTDRLNQLVILAAESGDEMTVERLLCRWVRAAIDPAWSPGTAADYEALSDGWLLWDILVRWSAHTHDRNILARLAGWLLERVERLTRPLTALGWRGLADLLWDELGRRRAAIHAMEAALAHDDSGPKDADRLWEMLRTYWQGEGDVVPPRPDIAWFIQTLYRHEEFGERKGYSTLLALALSVHGKSRQLAGKLAMSAVPFLPWKDGECPEFPDVARPAEWQAAMLVGMDRFCEFRRALARYPEPFLSVPDTPFDLPQEPVSGLWVGDGSIPLLQDFGDGPVYSSENPPPWRGRMECLDPPPGHVWLEIPEMVSLPNGIGVATRFFCHSGKNDFMHMCAVQILRLCRGGPGGEPLLEQYYPVPTPSVLKSAKPRRPVWRSIRLWKAHPYATGLLGEVEFTLGDEAFGAQVPCFALDRHDYVRGMPVKAHLYGFFPEKPSVGFQFFDDLSDCVSFERRNCENIHSYYDVCGVVRRVDPVSVAGGGTVLRLEIEVGGAVGTLPVFAHESRLPQVDGRLPAPGDLLDGPMMLFADVSVPDEETRERWKAAHPGGEPTPLALEREPRRPPIGLVPKEDASEKDWMEALRKWGSPDRTPFFFPMDFDDGFVTDMAVEALCQLYRTEDVAYQSYNPRGIDVTAKIGDAGEIHHYRVVCVHDDEKAPTAMPPGIEPLVIRIRDLGLAYLVEYEGALRGI